MAQFATELFVQCVYGAEISYEELLTLEGEIKVALTDVMEKNGGEYIHFEEMGDTMRMQCVFPEFDENLFHAVCEGAANLMDGRVEARMLFVDKDLDGALFYTLSDGDWQECMVGLAPAGPITIAQRDKDPLPRRRVSS
ncbi:hypothetical protein LJC15_01300 [Desulfovibrio sp. OttesenSCG-928-G11]|nr:hypothetical protein [Desulfovibrio sp. OttesenSCG-928-G11]